MAKVMAAIRRMGTVSPPITSTLNVAHTYGMRDSMYMGQMAVLVVLSYSMISMN